ncbi:MAG TPA: hypothetical protein VK517_04210, partial [Cyclobacteriaceae bacterium]|nr:hypothetical protein [Cyclobacteriaceae bacterium]
MRPGVLNKINPYGVSDHLGNVRAVIGAPHTDVFLATMESEVATAEDRQFKNIAPRSPWVNPTVTPPAPAGNEAVILNGTRIAGPSIVLSVAPGDMITAEVYAYYEGCSNCASTQPLSTIIGAIAGAFGGVSGAPGDPGKIYSAFNSTLAGGTGAAAGSGDNTIPGAHLNMIMLDGNMLPDVTNLPNASTPVTIAANWAKQKLTVSTATPIPVPGYVYIYVKNNSNSSTPVYFDDLKVTQLHSPYVA